MNFLSSIRLRTKLALLVGIFSIGLIAAMALGATTLQGRMFDVDKLRATVAMGQSLVVALDKQVAAGKINREQELAQLRETVRATRFDNGDGYLTLFGLNGATIIHGTDPTRDGKPSTTSGSQCG